MEILVEKGIRKWKCVFFSLISQMLFSFWVFSQELLDTNSHQRQIVKFVAQKLCPTNEERRK